MSNPRRTSGADHLARGDVASPRHRHVSVQGALWKPMNPFTT